MREKLLAHIAAHGTDGLDELPRAAISDLSAHAAAKARPEPPGGDG